MTNPAIDVNSTQEVDNTSYNAMHASSLDKDVSTSIDDTIFCCLKFNDNLLLFKDRHNMRWVCVLML